MPSWFARPQLAETAPNENERAERKLQQVTERTKLRCHNINWTKIKLHLREVLL